jgi:uncharacterized integral membrane protein (TIGR00698 family)
VIALTWPTIGVVRERVQSARGLTRGLVACAIIAGAAGFLAEHYTAPVMLLALLLGMAMNFLSEDEGCKPGVLFASRTILRVGVALLGARITLGQILALGWEPLAIVLSALAVTISVSVVVARLLGFNPLFGVLTGGATAICGASAALALSAALPAHPRKEQATLFTIVAVSLLSTAAMIGYPLIATWLHLSPRMAGVFIGGTIHDVAQVVGAGYSLSPEVGDTATVVKLARVAMLAPIILIVTLVTREKSAEPGAARPPLLPWFAVAFLAVAVVNSLGWIPHVVADLGGQASRWCLVLAIAALGMKTNLRQLLAVGPRPILLMVGETVFLAGFVLLFLHFLPR